MIQKQGEPYALWQETAVIWAATNGYLDSIEDTEVVAKIGEMLLHFEANEKKLIEDIEKEKALSDEIKEALDKAVKGFFSK